MIFLFCGVLVDDRVVNVSPYYTATRRYDFYFNNGYFKQYFYSLAALAQKILFLTRENKLHIFKPPCNFLFYYSEQKKKKNHDFIQSFNTFYSSKSKPEGRRLLNCFCSNSPLFYLKSHGVFFFELSFS